MKKVVIIGAGFGGLAAFSKLRHYSKKAGLEITLVNDKKLFSFLPMLPDCLGRGINPGYLSYDLAALGEKNGFDFVIDKVFAVDLAKQKVLTSVLNLDYDYLIIASGSETNFYGNDAISKSALKLDDVEDARAINRGLESRDYDSYIITGGGYTGIEVATNIRVYLNKKKLDKKIIVVERAASILGPLPRWMKDYVSANLARLRIEVLTNTAVEKAEAGELQLSGGRALKNAMLIWAAGVKTGDFIQDLNVEKNGQGRIKVDEYLRVNNSCFAIGDAAYFNYKNNFLRMAVQFAIMQGDSAARNVIRSLRGDKLVKYIPVDFGYIIPMANNRSCGVIFGINMKGFIPTLLHYFMCIYRSRGLKNKFGIIKNLITGGLI